MAISNLSVLDCLNRVHSLTSSASFGIITDWDDTWAPKDPANPLNAPVSEFGFQVIKRLSALTGGQFLVCTGRQHNLLGQMLNENNPKKSQAGKFLHVPSATEMGTVFYPTFNAPGVETIELDDLSRQVIKSLKSKIPAYFDTRGLPINPELVKRFMISINCTQNTTVPEIRQALTDMLLGEGAEQSHGLHGRSVFTFRSGESSASFDVVDGNRVLEFMPHALDKRKGTEYLIRHHIKEGSFLMAFGDSPPDSAMFSAIKKENKLSGSITVWVNENPPVDPAVVDIQVTPLFGMTSIERMHHIMAEVANILHQKG